MIELILQRVFLKTPGKFEKRKKRKLEEKWR